jgi:hypothetical protein
MILKLFFNRLSIRRQAEIMKRRGIILGTRKIDGRQSYLYMLNSLFAEILYENDNPGLRVEALVVMNGLNNLNEHLSKPLR